MSLSNAPQESSEQNVVDAHLKLLDALVDKYRRYARGWGVERAELVSEGYLSARQGEQKYRPDEGEFSDYISNWMRAGILKAIANAKRARKFQPISQQNGIRFLEKTEKAFRDECPHTKPSVEELAQRMERTVAAVLRIIDARAKQIIFLDSPVRYCDSEGWWDIAPHGDNFFDPEQQGAFEQIFRRQRTVLVHAKVQKLPHFEQSVVKARYGLDERDGEEMSAKEIAEQRGCTAKHVRITLAKVRPTLERSLRNALR